MLAGIAVLPVATRAQTIPAACRPLIDAQRKEITTPHHTYVTEGPQAPGGTTTTSELISSGGATYVLHRGQWKRSPMTPQDELAQLEENLTNTRQFSCQRVGEASVGGVPAVVYVSHNESEDLKADARIWIAAGTGLVLRTEEDLDTGNGDKRHISIRYDYANVRAPAVAP
jgi:hypothetical protein